MQAIISPGAVQGEPVTISISGAAPGPVRCRVRHHDGGETLELTIQRAVATFTPDRSGRWWVGVRSSNDFIETPFWVKARRVES